MSRASLRSGASRGSQQRIVSRSVRITYGGGGCSTGLTMRACPAPSSRRSTAWAHRTRRYQAVRRSSPGCGTTVDAGRPAASAAGRAREARWRPLMTIAMTKIVTAAASIRGASPSGAPPNLVRTAGSRRRRSPRPTRRLKTFMIVSARSAETVSTVRFSGFSRGSIGTVSVTTIPVMSSAPARCCRPSLAQQRVRDVDPHLARAVLAERPRAGDQRPAGRRHVVARRCRPCPARGRSPR